MPVRSTPASLTDLRLLGRHQIAASLASAVDFGLMIGFVELAHFPPAVATFFSATAGGITNFTFSRHWAFRSRHVGSVPGQAVRYAAVSLGGALLNASLVGLVLAILPVSYVIARIAIAIAVSLGYTYPMHTRIVFRVQAHPTELVFEEPNADAFTRDSSEHPTVSTMAREMAREAIHEAVHEEVS